MYSLSDYLFVKTEFRVLDLNKAKAKLGPPRFERREFPIADHR